MILNTYIDIHTLTVTVFMFLQEILEANRRNQMVLSRAMTCLELEEQGILTLHFLSSPHSSPPPSTLSPFPSTQQPLLHLFSDCLHMRGVDCPTPRAHSLATMALACWHALAPFPQHVLPYLRHKTRCGMCFSHILQDICVL
jgi:hypothetical protein